MWKSNYFLTWHNLKYVFNKYKYRNRTMNDYNGAH